MRPTHAHAGTVFVLTGPMFAGKSERLSSAIRRALIAQKQVQAFKHSADDRYDSPAAVATHDGRKTPATPVASASRILDLVGADTDIVAIDEAQFFGPDIVDVVTELALRGLHVVVAGTATDFAGRPFGAMGALLAVADHIEKLTAICVQCGNEASMNQRLVNGEPARANDSVVLVGSTESYEARCRACHEVRPPAGTEHAHRVTERGLARAG